MTEAAMLDELLDELENEAGFPRPLSGGVAEGPALSAVAPAGPNKAVGKQVCGVSERSQPAVPVQQLRPTTASPGEEDLDALLDDLSDLSTEQWAAQVAGSGSSGGGRMRVDQAAAPVEVCSQKQVRNASGVLKCSTPVLGLADGGACDQLRCTDCDFLVVAFANYAWNKDVDYLFLRNNIPEFHKLRPRLITTPGARAYACQCVHTTVRGTQSFRYGSPFKWVCGGHND